jgi:hypothetical protein
MLTETKVTTENIKCECDYLCDTAKINVLKSLDKINEFLENDNLNKWERNNFKNLYENDTKLLQDETVDLFEERHGYTFANDGEVVGYLPSIEEGRNAFIYQVDDLDCACDDDVVIAEYDLENGKLIEHLELAEYEKQIGEDLEVNGVEINDLDYLEKREIERECWIGLGRSRNSFDDTLSQHSESICEVQDEVKEDSFYRQSVSCENYFGVGSEFGNHHSF